MDFALIGRRLSYSLSGDIHRRLLKMRGIDANYSLIEIPENALANYDFSPLAGFNITAPYKTAVIDRLNGLSQTAARLKSVNTVTVKNGKMQGFNTDYYGFLRALEYKGHSLCGNVAVMGAGGVARTFCFAAAKSGCDINLIVRPSSQDKANQIKTDLIKNYNGIKVEINRGGRYDTLINATPAGTLGNPERLPFGADAAENCGYLFDAVYNPQTTPLIKMAKNRGIPCQNGLLMLVFQAVKSQEIWLESAISQRDEQEIIDYAKSLYKGGGL